MKPEQVGPRVSSTAIDNGSNCSTSERLRTVFVNSAVMSYRFFSLYLTLPGCKEWLKVRTDDNSAAENWPESWLFLSNFRAIQVCFVFWIYRFRESWTALEAVSQMTNCWAAHSSRQVLTLDLKTCSLVTLFTSYFVPSFLDFIHLKLRQPCLPAWQYMSVQEFFRYRAEKTTYKKFETAWEASL